MYIHTYAGPSQGSNSPHIGVPAKFSNNDYSPAKLSHNVKHDTPTRTSIYENNNNHNNNMNNNDGYNNRPTGQNNHATGASYGSKSNDYRLNSLHNGHGNGHKSTLQLGYNDNAVADGRGDGRGDVLRNYHSDNNNNNFINDDVNIHSDTRSPARNSGTSLPGNSVSQPNNARINSGHENSDGQMHNNKNDRGMWSKGDILQHAPKFLAVMMDDGTEMRIDPLTGEVLNSSPDVGALELL
jgi:hypothetical protein